MLVNLMQSVNQYYDDVRNDLILKDHFSENVRSYFIYIYHGGDAEVAELVDALDLGSSGVTRESSSLSFRKA
jgi:hypothetical protein